ncbi:nucleotidyltransferase domain-containing protein [Gilvimarinus sp. F26214L]|uniref:nucleotidyltransferase domain-containing protein n=1 Tax=Gilvimarinus sp. DZF01 TaxID=3461371 RepID=UPI0040456949
MALNSAIGDALFTRTQQQVLGLLFSRPEQTFYLNEIVRLAGMGKGTVKRELERLRQAGLLTSERRGNQTHYQANAECPIFSELRGIVLKTFGVVDVLKQALDPILDSFDIAFVYGSVAKGQEHAGSDVDLMIVGDDVSYSDLINALLPAEERLGRTINPTVYTPAEFSKRIAEQQHFVTRVMGQGKLWIKGEDHGGIK